MHNKIIFNQLPPDPPPRRSQRIANKSVKKSNNKRKQRKSSKMKKQRRSSSKQSQENIVELKKRSKKVQSHRPSQLTAGVFPTLYNSLVRVKATVQIIEWRKKRENCYSVRVSDGYFRIKVLATGQGGKELAKDEIKQFYILDCFIDHQGQGVCIMSKILKWYEYGFSIGFTEAWKMNKINHNSLGSNKIQWSKWEKFVDHIKGKQGAEIKQQRSKKQRNNSQTEVDENTVTLGLVKKQTEQNNQVTQSKRQFSTCKTQSISISGSRSKIKYEQKIKVGFKKVPQTRITQECFIEELSNKQIGFVSASKKNIIEKQSNQNLSVKKSNRKLSNHDQKSKYLISSNQYDFLFEKSQLKPKKLLISAEDSQKSSVKEKQIKIQINQKHEGLERTQSLNQNDKEAQDSWDDFLQDFVVFQQAKKNQSAQKTKQNNPKQQVQLSTVKQEDKLKILEQLFDDSESNTNSDTPPKSHAGQNNFLKPLNSFLKQTQTYSPQNVKSKKSHRLNFDDLFDEQSQTNVQLDSNLPHIKITSIKKKQIKNEMKVNNFQFESNKKIDLKWISHELSNVKKKQPNITLHKQKSIVKKETTVKTQKTQTKIQTKNNGRNQVLIMQNQNLQGEIYSICDLIEAEDYQSFCAYKGIVYQDRWFLKVKFLYIQKSQKQDIDPDKSNFLKPNSKIKELYLKCLAMSENVQHLCAVMLSKNVKQKYDLKEGQTYLIQSPIIVQNHSSENQFMSYPQHMYQHWVEISAAKNHKIIKVKNDQNKYKMQKQLWIDPLQSIDFKQQNDLVNIMGFIKSVKVNNFGNKSNNNFNSKYDSKGDNSNSNQYSSLKSNSQMTKRQPLQSKTMTIVEIIDPFTGFQTQFTEFGTSQLTSSKCMPIAIFRGKVNNYKNKKSLISKSETIVIVGQFIDCYAGEMLKNFYQENIDNLQKAISNIQVQLIGYQEAFNIEHVISFKQNSKILIKNTKIFSISRISYISCKKCSKKIYEGRCSSCGTCTKQDIIERTLFTGSIGDETGSLRFFVQKAIAEKYVEKSNLSKSEKIDQVQFFQHQFSGEQNPWERNISIEDGLSLNCVCVWFLYQGLQKPISIDKIGQGNFQKNITNLLEYLKSAYD